MATAGGDQAPCSPACRRALDTEIAEDEWNSAPTLGTHPLGFARNGAWFVKLPCVTTLSPTEARLFQNALGELRELLGYFQGAKEQIVWRHPAHADYEALALIEIAVGHVDAMLLLAEASPFTILSAAALSRSAYEASFIAAWLLEPEQPLDREQRFLGYLRDHVRFYENLADEFSQRAPSVSGAMIAVKDHWEAAAEAFAQRLPAERRASTPYPGVKSAIVVKQKQYWMYRELSQLMHAEPKALSYAPRELRVAADPARGDTGYSLHNTAGDWAIVIGMAGEAVIWPLELAVQRLSEYSSDFAVADWNTRFTRAVDSLARGPAVEPEAGHVFTFGYGSNMCLGRLKCRVPSAEPVATAELRGFRLVFNKRSADGSAKANVESTNDPADYVLGAVFDLLSGEVEWLDDAEGLGAGYKARDVSVTELGTGRRFVATTYVAEDTYIVNDRRPYTWYKRHIVEGARHFGLPDEYIANIEGQDADEDADEQRSSRQRRFPCDRDLSEDERHELDCN
jgi:gamma-glutamylcyclotransferase